MPYRTARNTTQDIALKDLIAQTMTAGVGQVKQRSYFHSLRKRRRRETSRICDKRQEDRVMHWSV